MISWLLCTWWLGVAEAGNDRGNAYGAEAALTAGALVATTREAESTWYNPAGLGGTERTRLNVNLSAFVMRVRQSDAFVTTRLGDQVLETPGSATQLVSVPSSVTLVRRVSPRTSLGLGVYVTRSDRVNVLSSIQRDVTEPWDTAIYTQSFQLLAEFQQFHAGLSFGTEANDRLRFGGSIMGVYDRTVIAQSFVSDLAGTLQGDPRRRTLELSSNGTFNSIGVRAVGAMQWEFVPHFSLGLVIRTPVLGFYTWGRSADTGNGTIEPTPPGAQSPFVYNERTIDETAAVQIDPMRISIAFGLAYPRVIFGIEGEIAFGVVADPVGSQRRVHGNATLGGRFQVRDRWWLGAGLFTDLSPTGPLNLLQNRQDFYGVTFGPEVRNPVRARGRDDGIVFSTTLGVRYAAGVGPFATVLYQPDLSGAPDAPLEALQPFPKVLVFHEISLLLGSSVAF